MLFKSEVWRRDIDRTLDEMQGLEELNGKSVLITGAAGLVCSAIVDLLIGWNERRGGSVRILTAGRWQREMTDRFGTYCDKPYFQYVPYDAVAETPLRARADYIIHGAGNAHPGLIMREPVETMLGIFLGLYRLLQTARDGGCRRVLYISSSEVYGQKQSEAAFREDEYGFVDPLSARSSYPVGKRAAETLCASFTAEYGVETVIARPGHIYGPTASPQDSRVSSAFAWQAARGEDIVMKSDGSQLRSYCHCLDCAAALLTVLLRGQSGQAYNISNPDSVITIRQMAELLASAGGVRLIREAADAAEKAGFNPMPNSSLSSERLRALGWRGVFDAAEGLAHTVQILKECLP